MNNRRSQKRLALTLIGVSLLLIGVLVIAAVVLLNLPGRSKKT